MEYSVIISGFGGQGVLMIGELLAHSGMKAGLNVTWMPSYGVEMRGGAANCTVVLSSEIIGAPITGRPKAVIAMSEPALKKFAPQLQAGCLLMVNSSLIPTNGNLAKSGVKTLYVPTLELAKASGSEKMSNVAMLGAFVAYTEIINMKRLTEDVKTFLPPEKSSLIEGINKALYKGQEFVHSLK